jgi:hypothetical protein
MKVPIQITVPVTEKTIDYILENLLTGILVLVMGIMVIACGAMIGFLLGFLIECVISLFTGIPPDITNPIINHPAIVICVIGGVILSLLYGLIVIGVVEIRFIKNNFGGTK